MDLNKDLKDIHINVNSSTFNILYRKYKSFLLPVLIILACLTLFLIIILPQVRSVLETSDQAALERIKLERLKNNYNLLTNMDEGTLNSNLQLLNSALPSNKDFAGVITAISDKALEAGVSIGDFSFNVGDITESTAPSSAYPSLQIVLNITANSSEQILNYIKLLYKSTPIAEISSINASGPTAALTLQFFYKSFPQGTISNDSQVTQLSPADLALITEMSSWKSSNPSDFLIPINSTEITQPQDSSSSGEIDNTDINTSGDTTDTTNTQDSGSSPF